MRKSLRRTIPPRRRVQADRWLGLLSRAGCLAALLFLPDVTQAQAPPEPEPAPYFDVVEVEVANIDVWVTDRDGQPVADLSRDDFVVRRDGKPVTITNFYAVHEGRPADEEPPTTIEEEVPEGVTPLPPRSDPLAPATEIAPEHRLWLIVFVDNFNLDPLERNRVLPAVWQFLGRTLRPHDRAMLVTHARSLEVRQPFTDEPARIQRALHELVKDTGYDLGRQRLRMDTLERIDRAGDGRLALGYARQYAEEQMNGVQSSVDALKRLVDTLGGLPGRKALLHVSSGMPMSAGEEMFHVVAERFGLSEAYGEIPRHDTSRSFEEVGRHANGNRVVFYTVDAGGLKPFEFGAAEHAGFVDPRIRQTLDSVVTESLQAPLRLMAIETGGRSILNQNEILPALEEVAEDFRSFYSLGIAAADSDSGRYHRVEVELAAKQRGWKIRHRPGYRSKTTDSRVRESLRSALLYAHQENPLGVEIVQGREELQSDGTYVVPLRILIPLQDLVILPRANGKSEVSLSLYYAAVGDGGATSEIDSAPLGLRLAEEHVEAARQESLVHTHRLQLSRGRTKIGVAILDRFGRTTSIVTRNLQVGPPEDDDASQSR